MTEKTQEKRYLTMSIKEYPLGAFHTRKWRKGAPKATKPASKYRLISCRILATGAVPHAIRIS